MHIDWRAVSHVTAAIVGTVVPGVDKVEQLAWQFGKLHGKEKSDAVVEMVQQGLAAAESVTARDLANDPDVERGTRAVIDAVVALHAIVGAKHAATT